MNAVCVMGAIMIIYERIGKKYECACTASPGL